MDSKPMDTDQHRKLLYKANDINLENSRLNRHELSIELRKKKKDDQLQRHRNISSNIDETQGGCEFEEPKEAIANILANIYEDDLKLQLIGIQAARIMYAIKSSSHFICEPIVQRALQFLQQENYNLQIQHEAICTLANFSVHTSEHVAIFIKLNAIPFLINMTGSPVLDIAVKAVYILVNVASVSPVTRDAIIANGAIDFILPLISTETPVPLLVNINCLFSNLCYKNPSIPQVMRMLPVVLQGLNFEDKESLADTCWALSNIINNDKVFEAVIHVLPRLVQLFSHDDDSVVEGALSVVVFISSETDAHVDAVMHAGAISALSVLLQNSNSEIVKEAAFIIGKIATKDAHVQSLFNANILNSICNVLQSGDARCQERAVWIITSITMCSKKELIIQLMENYDLQPFYALLESKSADIVYMVLCGVSSLLLFAYKVNQLEIFTFILEENGTKAKLQKLQYHDNENIRDKASSILSIYFEEAEDSDEAQAEEGTSDNSTASLQAEDEFKFIASHNLPEKFEF